MSLYLYTHERYYYRASSDADNLSKKLKQVKLFMLIVV